MSDPLALVIEDDDGVAQAYADVLQAAGFTTEIARDGRAALQRLVALTPALVVLDMNLPLVSGAEILRYLRADARLSRTRVIVTTGEPQKVGAFEKDADLVLIKPVSVEQLSMFAARLRPDAD